LPHMSGNLPHPKIFVKEKSFGNETTSHVFLHAYAYLTTYLDLSEHA
jgi:hypothetical protein